MAHPFASLALDLLSLAWPSECLSCGLPDRDWCSSCRAAFHRERGVIEVAPDGPAHVRWCASGVYEGALKTLIGRYKHEGQLKFAPHLARALRRPLEQLMRAPDARGAGGSSARLPLIIPMPSKRSRARERGFRHLEVLLRHTGAPNWREGARVLAPALGRSSQVGLDERERQQNAARLFVRDTRLVWGRPVILVDDIITTGATLRAASHALSEAGARVVGAAALAATQRLHEGR